MGNADTATAPPTTFGILEWFHFGRLHHVERVLADLSTLGVNHLRTGISWADWHAEGGQQWITELIEKLSAQVNVLPCFVYTPPHLGIAPRTSSPPKDIGAYAEFVDEILQRFGRHFTHVELWNEPNNPVEWDATLDPEWKLFAQMISRAAQVCKKHGKTVVLGGMSPRETRWLRLVASHGLFDYVDIVGIHGFPGTWEHEWKGWRHAVEESMDVLREYRPRLKLWITEAGFSTLGEREAEQVALFQETLEAPVERVYWYSLYDLPSHYQSTFQHITGRFEAHEHHMGMRRADGAPKLLFQHLQQTSMHSTPLILVQEQ